MRQELGVLVAPAASLIQPPLESVARTYGGLMPGVEASVSPVDAN